MRALFLTGLILVVAPFAQATGAVVISTNSLRFFIVSDEENPAGRYVNVPGLPNVGYISDAPNLVVTNLQAVVTNAAHWSERYLGKETERSEPALEITMFRQDARRIGDLTRQNIGRRILLMLGERPIIAPLIRSPIDSGSMQITLHNQEELKKVAAALLELVPRE